MCADDVQSILKDSGQTSFRPCDVDVFIDVVGLLIAQAVMSRSSTGLGTPVQHKDPAGPGVISTPKPY